MELERSFDLLEAMANRLVELPLIILTTGGESRLMKLLDSAAARRRHDHSTGAADRHDHAVALRRGGVEFAPPPISRCAISWRSSSELGAVREAHDRLGDRARELEALSQDADGQISGIQRATAPRNQRARGGGTAREELRRKLSNTQEEERRRIARSCTIKWAKT